VNALLEELPPLSFSPPFAFEGVSWIYSLWPGVPWRFLFFFLPLVSFQYCFCLFWFFSLSPKGMNMNVTNRARLFSDIPLPHPRTIYMFVKTQMIEKIKNNPHCESRHNHHSFLQTPPPSQKGAPLALKELIKE